MSNPTDTGLTRLRVLTYLPDNHPIYSVVGRIASEWSHLEHLLDLIIWDLLDDHNPKVACVTSQLMGTAPRIRAILSLLTLRSHRPETQKIVEEINRLNQKTYDVSERRNRAIHDPWYMETLVGEPGQPAQFKSMPSKNPQFGITDVDQQEQIKLIADIKALTERAAKLRNEIQSALIASGERPPPPQFLGYSRSST